MDEGRDRTALYRWALELEPEWVFTLDGDEVLDSAATLQILRAMDKAPHDVNVFGFQLVVMATEPNIPMQKRYTETAQIDRAFRVRDADPTHIFESGNPRGLHCGAIPKMIDRKKQKLNTWILHYGYSSPAAVEKRRAFYGEHDPENFQRLERMWRERARSGVVALRCDLNAQEMGITGTVTY